MISSNPKAKLLPKRRSESSIQTAIIKRLKTAGWQVIKLIQTNTNGIPDLLAIRAGRYVWIEVKSEDGCVSPLQEYRHKELQMAGAEVIIARSEEYIAHLCQKH